MTFSLWATFSTRAGPPGKVTEVPHTHRAAGKVMVSRGQGGLAPGEVTFFTRRVAVMVSPGKVTLSRWA